MIHPTAVIDPTAEIGEDVEIGPYSIIEKGAFIDSGTRIRSHVFIGDGTRIGKRCHLFQFASIGEAPQALAYRGEKTSLLMGDQNIVRDFALPRHGETSTAVTKRPNPRTRTPRPRNGTFCREQTFSGISPALTKETARTDATADAEANSPTERR